MELRWKKLAYAACIALALTAQEALAEHKLCVNDSTGATRVIEAPERCRKSETAVIIPHKADGETAKATSYTIPGSGSGGYMSVTTAAGGAQLHVPCNYGDSSDYIGWFSFDSSITAGTVQVFNAIEGQPFQAFNDLRQGGGLMDISSVPVRPWSGVFTVRQGKALSRFELTMSNKNARGDCLVTLFSIGLGSVDIVQAPTCPAGKSPDRHGRC
jgi:hypothetical protein